MPPPLRDYQHVGVEFLRAQPKSALFLDMGLGKTCISLTALTPDHFPVTVVAPKRVAEEVWPEEGQLWRPDLTLAVASGSAAQRRAALRSGADIVAIGRDNVKDLMDAPEPRTLILDELSSFKSRGVRWKVLNNIINGRGSEVAHVWGLTGTPAPNGLLDLWPQIALLDKGERLGRNITAYRSRYFVPKRPLPNGVIPGYEVAPGDNFPDQQELVRRSIHKKIEDICLSMGTDGRVDLPPLTYNEVNVRLTPAVAKVYTKLQQTMLADLEMLGGKVHTAKNAATLTGKLSQLTAGFLYDDDYDLNGVVSEIHGLKIDALKEIIEGTGSPVLVAYQYMYELEMLKKAFPHARTISERGIMAEWNAGRVPLLLAHPRSAGHGLNLQHGGYTIVWMTLTWDLEEWQQFNKRLHRSGQKNPVVIHLLMAKGPNDGKTVDHLKLGRLGVKDNVQMSLLDALESPL